MRSRTLILLLTGVMLLFVQACTTPVGYSERSLCRYDKDTTYRVDDAPNGFSVTIYYSRYQFIPESSAVLSVARGNLFAICHEVAERRGRHLQPIDEQRVMQSMGRNGFSGVTSWTGSVRVFYK